MNAVTRLAALSLAVAAAGCAESENEPVSLPASHSGEAAIPMPKPPLGALPLRDQLALSAAQTACVAQDYVSFFDAMIQSSVVRQTYSAPSIVVIRRDAAGNVVRRTEVTAEAYDAFPIRMEDYERRPSSAITSAHPDESVVLSINQSQSDVIAVEWARVRYTAPTGNGDERGSAVRLDGRPYEREDRPDGTLLLEPTATCWALAVDDRPISGLD